MKDTRSLQKRSGQFRSRRTKSEKRVKRTIDTVITQAALPESNASDSTRTVTFGYPETLLPDRLRNTWATEDLDLVFQHLPRYLGSYAKGQHGSPGMVYINGLGEWTDSHGANLNAPKCRTVTDL